MNRRLYSAADHC